MDMQLTGRVAVVCGASRGIGRACATSLAREGAQLVICARSEEPLRAAAAEIAQETGSKVVPIVCDVNRGEDLERLIAESVAQLGGLDILITNVAHPKMGKFSAMSEADWRTGFDTLFLPTLRLLRLALPHMRERRWGRIVNIASSAIKEPSSTYLVSGVFRIAIASMFKSVATEYGRDGICINTVCPGLFRTPLGESIISNIAQRDGISVAEAESSLAAQTVVGRIGEPEQLASLVTYLCSQHSGHITGQVIAVDGGKGRGLF